MKLYEGMFLFDSNAAGKDWLGLEKHVGDLLERHDAKLEHSERWPDRRLAYEIKGCKKGTYYLTYFRAPPTAIDGLKRDCELSERVLRVLILQDENTEASCQSRLERQGEATGSDGAPAEAAKVENTTATAPAATTEAPAASEAE